MIMGDIARLIFSCSMLWFLEREVESHSEARNLSALNIKSGTESSGTDFRDWIFLEGSKNTTGGDLHFTIWNLNIIGW